MAKKKKTSKKKSNTKKSTLRKKRTLRKKKTLRKAMKGTSTRKTGESLKMQRTYRMAGTAKKTGKALMVPKGKEVVKRNRELDERIVRGKKKAERKAKAEPSRKAITGKSPKMITQGPKNPMEGKELIKYVKQQKPAVRLKWWERLLRSRKGKLGIAAALGAGGIAMVKRDIEKIKSQIKAPVRKTEAKKETTYVPGEGPMTKGKAADIPKPKAPAKETPKKVKKSVAKAKRIGPEKAVIAPQTARKMHTLRQRHGITRGGDITGEEAFIAAAATAIGGQVPGIYKASESIAGFLGKNLQPLGLAGLAGGATYAIARYLSRRRQGKDLWTGKDYVDRAKKKTGIRTPSKKAKRPALSGLYARGTSKRRKRAMAA